MNTAQVSKARASVIEKKQKKKGPDDKSGPFHLGVTEKKK
jgi:hypothetical protein